MRKPAGLVGLVGLVALAGAVLGAVGVLASRWWSLHHDDSAVEYGGSYVPLRGLDIESTRPYASTLTIDSTRSTDWVALLWPAIVGGAVAAVVLAVMVVVVQQRLVRANRPGSAE